MPHHRCYCCRVYGDLMSDLIARYIREHDADKYQRAGWDVIDIPGRDGTHSLLATVPISAASEAGKALRYVCLRYGFGVADILSQKRAYDIVRVRQIGMWLAYTAIPVGYPAIGRSFRRDHTTVMYAVKKINALRQEDGVFCIQTDNDLASFKEMYSQEAA